jgi:hypothetical protein
VLSPNSEQAGDPNNIKFVKGATGNLEEHSGDFRNATSGELINRSDLMNNSLAILTGIQILTSEAIKAYDASITGVSEGWRFTGGVPNPFATTISDPQKAAVTLDGETITVYGAKGSVTDYTVHDGNYYPNGSDKPVDPSTLKGADFDIKQSCKSDPDHCA